jgi:hypothetical protein
MPVLSILFVSICSFAFAQTPDCKSISNPLERLHCYDGRAEAPSPPIQVQPSHLIDSIKSIGISIIHSPPAVAAIVAAFLAFLSGVLGPSVQLRIGKLQSAVAQRAA